MPGLLQTTEYMRSVLATNPDREWMVQKRLSRQRAATEADGLQTRFVIEESVLRRLVGGRAVLRAQLEHLLTLGAEPGISVRVLPMNAGMSSGLDGSFMLLEFPGGGPNAYVEAPGTGLILTRSHDVDPFVTVFDELDSLALDEQRSALLITEMTEDLPDGRRVLA